MNTKINSSLAIGIIIFIAIAFGVSVWWQSEKIEDFQASSVSVPLKENKGVICTQEAKQCPNGSYVSRTGPNCEFAPCPGANSGKVLIEGGDRDEHGCIGTAGYQWCEKKQKCLRGWEEDCGDWEVYKNEEYGYQISYPADWFVYANDTADIFIQPAKGEEGNIPGPHANAFEIKITSGDDAIQEERKNLRKLTIAATEEPVVVGGVQGTKITAICDGIGCGAPEWFISKDNKSYRFNSSLGYSSVSEKILSTFKFIK